MDLLLRVIASGGSARRSQTKRLAALVLFAIAASVFAVAPASSAVPFKMISARTADRDPADGRVDHISVVFSAPADVSKFDGSASGFSVDGYTISSVSPDATSTQVDILLIPGSIADTDATPLVRYTQGGKAFSLAGDELEAGDVKALDGAQPVLMAATAREGAASAALMNDTQDIARFTFSEPVTILGGEPETRARSLEQALRVGNNNASQSTGCEKDGDGASAFNFPQKNTGTDPIDLPLAGGFSRVIQVTFKTGNTKTTEAPNARFTVNPATVCPIAVAAAVAGTPGHPLIADASGNAAAADPAGRRTLAVGEIELNGVSTRDANGDGMLDRVELVFESDARIDDATVEAAAANMAITIGSDTVHPSGVSGPSGDNTVELVFESSWPTDARPQVTYAASGCGIGGTAFAGATCASAFGVKAIDSARPVALRATALDVSGDGKTDTVRVAFSEPIKLGSISGWTVDGTPPLSFARAADGRSADLTVAPVLTTAMLVRYDPALAGGTVDDNGNEVATANLTAIDGTGPSITAVRAQNRNQDGTTEKLVVEFSRAVLDPAVPGAASQFTYGGAAASAVDGPSGDDLLNDNTLTLVISSTGTDTKEFAYTPGSAAISDAGGHDVAATTITADTVKDEAAPVGAVTLTPDPAAVSLPGIPAGRSSVKATYSEPMLLTPPQATFNTTKPVLPVVDADHVNGWRTDQPNVWEGVAQITPTDCTSSAGCSVPVVVDGAQDRSRNAQAAPATANANIDTQPPGTPSNVTFSAVVADGETVPANTINMFTSNIGMTGMITPGDATDGYAEVYVDGAPLSPAAVSDPIEATDTSVTASSHFANAAALRGAIAEGAHSIVLRICDVNHNCTALTEGAIAVTSDYTAPVVAVTQPNGGESWKAGEQHDVVWSIASTADFDHVRLDLSTDGGRTWATPILARSTDQPVVSYTWTVPSFSTSTAFVRATGYDTNGNHAPDQSDAAFAITGGSSNGGGTGGGGTGGGGTGGGGTGGGGNNGGTGGGGSVPAAVDIDTPNAGTAFLTAGGTSTIRWAADGTLTENPITLEYSLDDGTSWIAINDGTYSHANDGEEVWSVPAGLDFDVRVRVSATDTADNTASSISSRLVKGVGGYVLEANGRIHGFGSANADTRETYVRSSDTARAIVRRTATTGYVMTDRGYVYPFAIGAAGMPARPSGRNLGDNMARGFALRSSAQGYVVDRYGRLSSIGGAPAAKPSKTWSGKDLARGIVMINTTQGYVLDAYGRLWPFAVGSNKRPRQLTSKNLFGTARAVGVILRANKRSGWVLDTAGKLAAFGGAPAVTSRDTGSGANARAAVKVTDTAGYWVDSTGRMHAWGVAWGDPSTVTFSGTTARGAI